MEKDGNIRLIWDFRGRHSLPTAEHHAIHLSEYLKKEGIEGRAGCEALNDAHHIAFMDVAAERMLKVRDSLRPHRAIKTPGE